MSKLDNTAQILGELVLYIPLLAFAAAAGLLLPCLIAMVCLFTYRQFYPFTVHLPAVRCLTLSYGSFAAIMLIYAGMQAQFKFMANQPMAIVLIMGVIALINAEAGQLLHDHELSISKLSELNKPFNLEAAAAQEIVLRCNQKHLSKDATEAILMRYVYKMTPQEIADKLHIEKASADTKLYRARKKLNSP